MAIHWEHANGITRLVRPLGRRVPASVFCGLSLATAAGYVVTCVTIPWPWLLVAVPELVLLVAASYFALDHDRLRGLVPVMYEVVIGPADAKEVHAPSTVFVDGKNIGPLKAIGRVHDSGISRFARLSVDRYEVLLVGQRTAVLVDKTAGELGSTDLARQLEEAVGGGVPVIELQAGTITESEGDPYATLLGIFAVFVTAYSGQSPVSALRRGIISIAIVAALASSRAGSAARALARAPDRLRRSYAVEDPPIPRLPISARAATIAAVVAFVVLMFAVFLPGGPKVAP
jgi:hypothetical protein